MSDFSEVPVQYRAILERIEKTLSVSLTIYDWDDEWLNFWSDYVTDAALIVQIEKHRFSILPGDDATKYQILTESDQDGDGLYIHHLSSTWLRSEYRNGVWFY